MRTRDPKYIRYFGEDDTEELYCLANDPHELTNLADDPKRKETVSRLRNTLFTWLEKRGDADPIATERKITQNKGAKPKKKGGKKK